MMLCQSALAPDLPREDDILRISAHDIFPDRVVEERLTELVRPLRAHDEIYVILQTATVQWAHAEHDLGKKEKTL